MPKEVKPPRPTIAGLQAQLAEMAKMAEDHLHERNIARTQADKLVLAVLEGEHRAFVSRDPSSRYDQAMARISVFKAMEGREIGGADMRVSMLTEERNRLWAFIERMSGLKPNASGPTTLGCDMASGTSKSVLLCHEHGCEVRFCLDRHRGMAGL
jgi:hypothetical protein